MPHLSASIFQLYNLNNRCNIPEILILHTDLRNRWSFSFLVTLQSPQQFYDFVNLSPKYQRVNTQKQKSRSKKKKKKTRQINRCIFWPEPQVNSEKPFNLRKETYLSLSITLTSRTFNLRGLSHTIINSRSSNMNCYLLYYHLCCKIMFPEGSQYVTFSSSSWINFTNYRKRINKQQAILLMVKINPDI